MRKNLVIVRAGYESMHVDWDDGRERNFDLLVSYYTNMDFFEDDSEHQHLLEGAPWKGYADVCRVLGEKLFDYEFVAFADDDILTTYADLNVLFVVCREYKLDLATPYISVNSPPDLPAGNDTLLRYMDRSDLICPVFSQRALSRLVNTFSESDSGWGLPQLWSYLCPHPAYATAVVDAIKVRHMRPFSCGRMQAGGVRPLQEQYRIFKKYGLEPRPRKFFQSVPLLPFDPSRA